MKGNYLFIILIELKVKETKESGPTKDRDILSAQLKAILTQLQFLKETITGQEKIEFFQAEWKCLAKLVDRLLFWICLIGFVSTVLYIYVD